MLPEAQNTWMLQIVPLAPLLPLLGALLILLPRLFTLERSEGYTFSVTLGVLQSWRRSRSQL